MLIVDTSAVLAQLRPRDWEARAAIAALRAEREPPVLPAPVAIELDYMLTQRGGANANDGLLRDLAAGRFTVPCLELADYRTIQALNQQYRDLDVGLTDLSIVVFAARFRTNRILTFDQRHFRTLRPIQGGSFNLVAFDEPVPPGR
jgi:predicted nucleic acid-binding protein